MLAFIIGTVADIADGCLILENNGIGYRVFVPGSVTERLSKGDEARIYTHMTVREDAITLYGFSTKDDLAVFRMLLGVSGIGPKGALSVLSVMSADDLRFAVLSDDTRTISKVPGIGKKTAQKLILELKDKLNLSEVLENSALGGKEVVPDAAAATTSAQSEAVMALTALGYSGTQALKAVRKVTADRGELPVEQILKLALKEM